MNANAVNVTITISYAVMCFTSCSCEQQAPPPRIFLSNIGIAADFAILHKTIDPVNGKEMTQ